MGLKRTLKKIGNVVKKVAAPVAGIIDPVSSISGVFGKTAQQVATTNIATGATGALAILPFQGFSDSGPDSVFTSPASSNNSNWMTDVLNKYLADREAKRAAEQHRLDLEFQQRQLASQLDFQLARERLVRESGQASNAFNPFLGNFSSNPMADAAGERRITPSVSEMPKWLMPVIIGMVAIVLLPAILRR